MAMLTSCSLISILAPLALRLSGDYICYAWLVCPSGPDQREVFHYREVLCYHRAY